MRTSPQHSKNRHSQRRRLLIYKKTRAAIPATPATAGTARALAALFLVALALAEVAEAAVELDSPDDVVVAPEVDASEEDAEVEDCRQTKVSFWCSKLR